tara:strand:+ start:139 stop:309 length:171 start_codon:yes stop_codon:yes gene_type:complete
MKKEQYIKMELVPKLERKPEPFATSKEEEKLPDYVTLNAEGKLVINKEKFLKQIKQ